MDCHLGTKLHLRPLSLKELPAHPDFCTLKPPFQPRPDLRAFVLELVAEATRFADNTIVNTFTQFEGERASPPSASPITVSSRRISAKELMEVQWGKGRVPGRDGNPPVEDELWFARTSDHWPTATEGTATWDEFDYGIRDQHSEHEAEYTPDVYDAREILGWNEQLRCRTLDRKFGDGIARVEMSSESMSWRATGLDPLVEILVLMSVKSMRCVTEYLDPYLRACSPSWC